MIDLSFLQIKPPYIALGSTKKTELNELLASTNCSPAERNTVFAVLELFERNNTAFCNAQSVAEHIRRSEESIRRHLISLESKGILEKQLCKGAGRYGRKSSLFTFKKSAASTETDGPEESTINSVVDPDSDLYGVIDRLMLMLCVCLEFSHKQKTEKKSSRIYINGAPIKVTTTASAGSSIAKIGDIRYYLAILKLAEGIMKTRLSYFEAGELSEAELLSTTFDIFEVDILQAMNKSTGGTERKNAKPAIERLGDTKHKLEGAPEVFLESHDIAETYTHIWHFIIKSYHRTNDGRIVYRLLLEDRQVNTLLKAAKSGLYLLTEIDPRIFAERNPLRIAITLFAGQIRAGSIEKFTWQSLKDLIAPSMAMTLFKKNMSQILATAAEANDNFKSTVRWDGTSNVVVECIAEINDLVFMMTKELGIQVQHNNIRRLRSNKKILYREIDHSLRKARQLNKT